MDLSAFYSQFREETSENIRILSDGLLALEQLSNETERRAQLDRMFRAVHTIKGSARMLGFNQPSDIAHELENILGELRTGQRQLDKDLADHLLRSGDTLLAASIAATESSQPEPSPEPAPPLPVSPAPQFAPLPATPSPAPQPAAPVSSESAGAQASRTAARQTIRVRVDRLDRMLNMTGELVVDQQLFTDHIEQLGTLRTLSQNHERALHALENELARLRFSAGQRQMLNQHLSALREITTQIQAMLGEQSEQFTKHTRQHDLLVRDLEQEVMAARLLPISTVYAGLPRVVRDLAQTTGKDVRLELIGETVELDRKVLELINDPLLHLVRNAIDHGIETAVERRNTPKPPTGTISVRAETTGGEVRVIISDDGRGMEPQRLRDRAVRLGLLSPERAARLSDSDALELIFVPGFSTANMITDISGRGVGMDVVRTNLSELGGMVYVESQLGRGTEITLTLPLTLVTTRVLLLQVGRSRFALPTSGCQGTIWIYRHQLRNIENQPTIEYGGRRVVVRPMAHVLGVETKEAFARNERVPAVLIGSQQRSVALLVDALLDERDAVVKPLGQILANQRIYSGAVQIGDGSLVLLLNPLQLTQSASGLLGPYNEPAAPKARQRSRLLVADDSFTTRELIRSILQSAGYDVTAAVDGADALDKLQAQTYDLVVSDVEMPRVNGFQLSERIRSELGLHELPVVLITSLASEEHRRRGLDAGARAYIVKSQFNQDGLLETIQQLLGHD